MISIRLIPSEGLSYRLRHFLDYAGELRDFGFDLRENVESPDLVFADTDALIDGHSSVLDRYRDFPAIFYNKVDTANIWPSPRYRSLLQRPTTLLWLMRNRFRDAAHHNDPVKGSRWFYRLLPEYDPSLQEERPIALSPDDLAKIRLVPVAHLPRFSHLRNITPPPPADRRIDVNFLGSIDFHHAFGETANAHRRDACRALIALRNRSTAIITNAQLTKLEFDNNLLRSRVSLCPFGLGEYGYRDYETILAGSVMLKPRCDYVETFAPDIYQSDRYYVACEPDFSDVSDRLDEILHSYDSHFEMAMRAREDLLRETRKEAILDYLVRLFRDAVARMDVSDARHHALRLEWAAAEDQRMMAAARIETCRKLIIDFMADRLERLGATEGGHHSYYEGFVQQGVAFTQYDLPIAQFLSRHPKRFRHSIDVGTGMGQLAALMAALDMTVTGVEAEGRRYRACSDLFEALGEDVPQVRCHARVLNDFFPSAQLDPIDGETAVIFTNVINTKSEETEDEMLEACRHAGGIVMDLVRFARARSSVAAWDQLIGRVRAMGFDAPVDVHSWGEPDGGNPQTTHPGRIVFFGRSSN